MKTKGILVGAWSEITTNLGIFTLNHCSTTTQTHWLWNKERETLAFGVLMLHSIWWWIFRRIGNWVPIPGYTFVEWYIMTLNSLITTKSSSGASWIEIQEHGGWFTNFPYSTKCFKERFILNSTSDPQLKSLKGQYFHHSFLKYLIAM